MSNSTTLTVRGFKVRSQSQRRYIVVVVQPNGYTYKIARYVNGKTVLDTITAQPGAHIHKRSDDLETARKHARRYGFPTGGNFAVVIDAYTGWEV